jgi:hypothetical protein
VQLYEYDGTLYVRGADLAAALNRQTFNLYRTARKVCDIPTPRVPLGLTKGRDTYCGRPYAVCLVVQDLCSAKGAQVLDPWVGRVEVVYRPSVRRYLTELPLLEAEPDPAEEQLGAPCGSVIPPDVATQTSLDTTRHTSRRKSPTTVRRSLKRTSILLAELWQEAVALVDAEW